MPSFLRHSNILGPTVYLCIGLWNIFTSWQILPEFLLRLDFCIWSINNYQYSPCEIPFKHSKLWAVLMKIWSGTPFIPYVFVPHGRLFQKLFMITVGHNFVFATYVFWYIKTKLCAFQMIFEKKSKIITVWIFMLSFRLSLSNNA